MDHGRSHAIASPVAPGQATTGAGAPSATATSASRPRIAYLSFSSGEYDARTMRMARSAVAAGYHVTVYARWHPDLPPVEDLDGYRLIRAPFDWELAVPFLRRGARRRAADAMASAALIAAGHAPPEDQDDLDVDGTPAEADPDAAPSVPRRFAGRVALRLTRPLRRWWRLAKMFPLRPLGWADALEAVAEPADIWHGMWAGSLPALDRMRRRHGGRTIYDSRDVYMQSRDFSRLSGPTRAILAGLERRWAQAADRVLTVNEPYADLLAAQLGVPRPPVVMNCPVSWDPPEPPPDHIREALGLPSSTAIALYQGHLMSERGIEQAMEAILEVPDAVLGLLGFGTWLDRLTEQTAAPPYLGKVMLLPPVPPDELVPWTASADVAIMAIQPTTINHRYTTPQKLFEAIAAGVPVVASDLPGMAGIVRADDLGILCDPTSPPAIAAGIRQLIAAPPEVRAARRASIRRAAHERYNWEAQLATLFELYDSLSPARVSGIRPPAATGS